MKKVSTLLMAIVILFGLVLALTPFIGSIFFPLPENSTQQAKSELAKNAISMWFNAPSNAFVDVQAVRKITNGKQISRFSYSTTPDVVRGFISRKGLQQKSLNNELMQSVFSDHSISWWQPEALQRETWFSGMDQGKTLSLIYNAQTQRGVLVIKLNN